MDFFVHLFTTITLLISSPVFYLDLSSGIRVNFIKDCLVSSCVEVTQLFIILKINSPLLFYLNFQISPFFLECSFRDPQVISTCHFISTRKIL